MFLSKKSSRKPKQKDSIFDLIRTFVYAILIAVAIRSLAYEPFNIPSGSMLPTLLEGDFVFVSKPTYGYSRYSFPFGIVPLPESRLFGSLPERGDVAVFKLPSNTSIDYIKRIVGLPGDRIQVKSGVLYINGEAVRKEREEDFVYTDRFGQTNSWPQYRETLPGGKSFMTLDINPKGQLDNTQMFVVPAGHYFAMGDNRDNSVDSRVPENFRGVGFVPTENLVGRADLIWYSTASQSSFLQFWDVLLQTRLDRLFTVIE